MKRLALVLTVAALAAVSCTTPGAVPATTTSSSTTQPGASAREAVIEYDLTKGRTPIDSSFYPAGATIIAETNLGGYCLRLLKGTGGGLGVEVPGSESCEQVVVGGEGVVRSSPVPLFAGEAVYVPAISLNGTDLGEITARLRVRW